MIAALFCRADSHYKAMPGVDAFDAQRDALTWQGGTPAVYHPPCRSWGQLKFFAKPRAGERELALWSLDNCRRFGGVIEHPLRSDLWKAAGCLTPGIRDSFGGVFITVNQSDFGHRALKATGLYIVGAPVPETPFNLAAAVHPVDRMHVSEREATPLPFCQWLVGIARSVQ